MGKPVHICFDQNVGDHLLLSFLLQRLQGNIPSQEKVQHSLSKGCCIFKSSDNEWSRDLHHKTVGFETRPPNSEHNSAITKRGAPLLFLSALKSEIRFWDFNIVPEWNLICVLNFMSICVGCCYSFKNNPVALNLNSNQNTAMFFWRRTEQSMPSSSLIGSKILRGS